MFDRLVVAARNLRLDLDRLRKVQEEMDRLVKPEQTTKEKVSK